MKEKSGKIFKNIYSNRRSIFKIESSICEKGEFWKREKRNIFNLVIKESWKDI